MLRLGRERLEPLFQHRPGAARGGGVIEGEREPELGGLGQVASHNAGAGREESRIGGQFLGRLVLDRAEDRRKVNSGSNGMRAGGGNRLRERPGALLLKELAEQGEVCRAAAKVFGEKDERMVVDQE